MPAIDGQPPEAAVKRLLLALVPLVLVIAACASDDDATSPTAVEESTAQEHNAADVEFAQAMVPHHRQAIEMAQIAVARSQNADVVALAEDIEAAQAPEIDTLETWLEEWDEPVEAGMGHGAMGGMMSDDDMAMLDGMQGPAFDRTFLEMMIEHHRGAIEMAATEVEDGQYPDALEMAEAITTTQQAEVAEMQRLLQGL
jgi:uncharacterized protein (DUF305 family)